MKRPFPTTNVVLFAATVVTTFWTGAFEAARFYGMETPGFLEALRPHVLARGWIFAVPLLTILLCHEFGHYLFARYHKVDASLPYFIPLPPPFLFGTMGAIIRMRSPIDRRDALLDIGAAGPLAGLVIAIPVAAYGLHHSFVGPVPNVRGFWQEGHSLLYVALIRTFVGYIPRGYDLFMHPMAFAGWGGFLVTMINLIPVAQLDGGHVAYAVLGPRQDDVSRWVHRGLALFALGIFVYYAFPGFLHGGPTGAHIGRGIRSAMNWLVWAFVLRILMRLTGNRHPPTGPGPLSPVRVGVAVLCLVAFAALFMPVWIGSA